MPCNLLSRSRSILRSVSVKESGLPATRRARSSQRLHPALRCATKASCRSSSVCSPGVRWCFLRNEFASRLQDEGTQHIPGGFGRRGNSWLRPSTRAQVTDQTGILRHEGHYALLLQVCQQLTPTALSRLFLRQTFAFDARFGLDLPGALHQRILARHPLGWDGRVWEAGKGLRVAEAAARGRQRGTEAGLAMGTAEQQALVYGTEISRTGARTCSGTVLALEVKPPEPR